MKAAIFCNTRKPELFPLNAFAPDCLLDVCGKTPLDEAVSVSGRFSGGVPAFVVGSASARISISAECGHKTVFADDTLGEELSRFAEGEELLLISAETAFMPDLSALMTACERLVTGCAVLVCAEGNGLKVRHRDGILVGISSDILSENTDFNGVLAGAVILSAELAARVSEYKFTSLSGLVTLLMNDDEHILAVNAVGSYFCINTPENYRKACLAAAGGLYLGRGAAVGEGACAEGCAVGENVSIGNRCTFRDCVIGEGSVIASGAEGTAAVIGECCKIGTGVKLGEGCVIGSGTSIGAGSEIAAGTLIPCGSRIMSGELADSSGSVGALLDGEGCFCAENDAEAAVCAVRLGLAAASQLERDGCAVVGHGEGDAARSLANALESGISSAGVTPLDVGECSPSCVTYLVSRTGAQLGLFVTAEGQCRIRVIVKGGLPLSEKFRCRLRRSYAFGLGKTAALSEQPSPRQTEGAGELYRSYLSGMLPKKLVGVNASVRCTSGYISKLANGLLESRSDSTAERILFDVAENGLSCTASDQKAGLVTHEQLLLTALVYAFSREQAVSLPASFPTAADTAAETYGGKLCRYPLDPTGETTPALDIARCPDNFFVRDALALICMVCSYLSEKSLTLSQAVEQLPDFSTVRRFVPTELSAGEVYSKLGAVREDGCGTVSALGGRAALRPMPDRSGLMIFAENTSAETASALCEDIIRRLRRS